jgi:4'-phosphopantetheinyl transferase EntD
MSGLSFSAQLALISVPDALRVSFTSPATPKPAHGDETMIEALIPEGASAEMHADAPEPTMFASEAACVAGAVAWRRREFATVRCCARDALRRIGMIGVPILPDSDRVPRWPAGVIGSMTHCEGYRAAAVARSDELGGIGIDAEPHAPVPAEALELLLRDEERAALRTLADAEPTLHWGRIAFCAKEAVFKAWFPLTRRWLDFEDVSTTVDPDGTFTARLLGRRVRVGDRELEAFTGRWVIDHGLVVAATSIPHLAARSLADALGDREAARG